MKRMILCLSVLFLAGVLHAQTKPKAKAKTQTTKTTAKKNSQKTTANTTAVRLNSANSYPAKSNTMSIYTTNFKIGDPILLALDARAAGADIKINKSGIVGMPKRAFGIANGKIFLGNTSSVTSGTQTGSGAVGTGTGLGTFGSISPVMGVNGKSPYAGLNMWGNATNMTIARADSAVRLNSIKQ